MTTTSWKDRIRQAFKTRSVDEFEKALEEKEKSDKPDDGKPVDKPADDKLVDKPADEGAGGVHHHITVNVGHAGGAEGEPATAGARAGATGAGAAGAGEPMDPISVIVDAITALAVRIDKLEQAGRRRQDGRPGGQRRG
jgi:hypothetical protein